MLGPRFVVHLLVRLVCFKLCNHLVGEERAEYFNSIAF